MKGELKGSANSIIGLTDITENKAIWKMLVAEFIGTLLLILIGCGSVITINPLKGDEDLPPAFAVQIALTFGLTIGTVAQSIGHISGCHINPAITLSMFVTGEIKLIKTIFYIIVQLLGAACGSAILKAIVPTERMATLGMTSVNPAITPIQGFIVEIIATFLLLFVIHGVCDGGRKDIKGSAPLAIGLAATACHLFAIQFTGSSLNPARSFGPAVIMNDWTNHWVYWVGPIIGGILAGVIYKLIFKETKAEGDSYDF